MAADAAANDIKVKKGFSESDKFQDEYHNRIESGIVSTPFFAKSDRLVEGDSGLLSILRAQLWFYISAKRIRAIIKNLKTEYLPN
jgi:hypothetical protein